MGSFLLGFLAFIFGIVIYLIPSFLATRKQSATTIILVNLLMGWTVVGWFVALLWAIGDKDRQEEKSTQKKPVRKALFNAEAAILELRGQSISFVAFDFETANRSKLSACALGVAVVENGEVVQTQKWLINPNTSHFEFTYLHGIKPEDVSNQSTFDQLWPEIAPYISGKNIIAHNLEFDLTVLLELLQHYRLSIESYEAFCSLQMARKVFAYRIPSFKLNAVCQALGIGLDHHNPVSDAVGCAKITLAMLVDRKKQKLDDLFDREQLGSLPYSQSKIYHQPVTIVFTDHYKKSPSFAQALALLEKGAYFQAINEGKQTAYSSTFLSSDPVLMDVLDATKNFRAKKVILAEREIKVADLRTALWILSLPRKKRPDEPTTQSGEDNANLKFVVNQLAGENLYQI